MNIFYRRPLMVCCALFLATSAIAFCVTGFVKQILAVSFAALALIALLIIALCKRRNVRIKLAVAAIALFLAVLSTVESWAYFDLYATRADEYIGKECTLQLMVVEERRSSFYESEYTVELQRIDGQEVQGRSILYFDSPMGLSRGEVLLLTASCVEPAELSYDADGRLALLADGNINAAFSVINSETTDVQLLDKTELFEGAFLELNLTLTYRLEKLIGGEAGKLASAMILGRRSGLSSETYRDFSRAGLSHLLSISGLHMAMLAGIFELLLRLIRIPKTVRCCITPAVMLGYLMLTGFQISALRAAIMLTVVYISFIASSPSDPITVLFATCAGIVAVMPSSAADVGFWMSFLATLGIIVSLPYVKLLFRRRQKDRRSVSLFKTVLRWITTSLAVTLAAVLSIVFLSWLCFGELSLVAPLANLYASPMTSAFMTISLAGLAFGGVPFVGDALSSVAGAIGNTMIDLTYRLSDLRGVTVSLEHDFAAVIVVLLSVSMAIVVTVKLKRKIFALVPPVIAAIAFAVCLAVTNAGGADELSLSYLRRGEREMLLISQNGTVVLCDFTDGSYSNYISAVDVAKEREAATEIEVLMLTHYHDRHRSSVERLMSTVKLRSIWLPEPTNEQEFYIVSELLKIAEAHGVRVEMYLPCDDLTVFETGKLMLNEVGHIDRSSQPQLSLGIEYGMSRAVYVGSSYLEDRELSGDFGAMILGTHGPNPKAEYVIGLSPRTKTVVFADEELLALASPDQAFPSDTTVGSEYKRIRLWYGR